MFFLIFKIYLHLCNNVCINKNIIYIYISLYYVYIINFICHKLNILYFIKIYYVILQVYPVRKYLFVFLVVIGVALFMYKDVNPLKKHSEGQTIIGELLLLLSLTMDGLTSAVQERMKSEHNSKSGHMMLNMNGWSVIFSGIVIIASGELLEFIQFLHKYPSTIWHIATFSIAGAFGQYFIFLTVAEFGPLPCSIITTTRKFFTVLGSILIFGNSLTSKQWMGTLIVFSGLFLDSMYGKDKSPRKDTTK